MGSFIKSSKDLGSACIYKTEKGEIEKAKVKQKEAGRKALIFPPCVGPGSCWESVPARGWNAQIQENPNIFHFNDVQARVDSSSRGSAGEHSHQRGLLLPDLGVQGSHLVLGYYFATSLERTNTCFQEHFP